MHTIKGYKDEWRIQEYLLLTFFISWLSWGFLILLTALNVIAFQSVLGIILFTIGGFGPTFAAIICMEGKLTFKKLVKFIFGGKKKTWGYFVLFAVAEVLIIGLSSMETNPSMPWYVLPVVFLICTIFGGGNEELGWRGTLQPILMRALDKKLKHPLANFVVSMLIIGAVWAVWHLPLWFVAGSTQQGIPFHWFAVSTILLAFWLGCLYVKTQSVVFCMMLHGLSNVLMSFFVIKINWILVLGFVVLTALSVGIVACGKPTSRQLRQKE